MYRVTNRVPRGHFRRDNDLDIDVRMLEDALELAIDYDLTDATLFGIVEDIQTKLGITEAKFDKLVQLNEFLPSLENWSDPEFVCAHDEYVDALNEAVRPPGNVIRLRRYTDTPLHRSMSRHPAGSALR